ncbi:hypothetical protein PS2_022922 [Malus domestica]
MAGVQEEQQGVNPSQVAETDHGDFVATMDARMRGACSAVMAEIITTRAAVSFVHNLVASPIEMQGDASLVINALQHNAAATCNGAFGHILNDA